MNQIKKIKKEIINHPANKKFTKKGWEPVFTAGPNSKIVVVGQAPGIRA